MGRQGVVGIESFNMEVRTTPLNLKLNGVVPLVSSDIGDAIFERTRVQAEKKLKVIVKNCRARKA